MIPGDAVLPVLHESVIPWDSLTAEEKKKECRKMELYAGMVDNLDYNIGRLIQHLKDIGQYDNTLIVFVSDNGAAGEDFYNHPHFAAFLREHFHNDYDNMGKPTSFVSYGPPWAEAGTSPFRYFKGYTTEGGINTPMILAGPNIERHHEISDAFATIMDIAPTLYEVAHIEYPKTFQGHALYPLRGNSLMPFASKKADQIHGPEYVFGLEHDHYAMIRKGDWKITSVATPFQENSFELFLLSNDVAERHDLKFTEPEKYKEMVGEWRVFSKEMQVRLPEPSPN
jgi:arylsulfatase